MRGRVLGSGIVCPLCYLSPQWRGHLLGRRGPLCKHSSFTQVFVYAITAQGVNLWNPTIALEPALVKFSLRRFERVDTGTSRGGPVSEETLTVFLSLVVISVCLFQKANVLKMNNCGLLQDSTVHILYRSDSFLGVNVTFLLYYNDPSAFFCHCDICVVSQCTLFATKQCFSL